MLDVGDFGEGAGEVAAYDVVLGEWADGLHLCDGPGVLAGGFVRLALPTGGHCGEKGAVVRRDVSEGEDVEPVGQGPEGRGAQEQCLGAEAGAVGGSAWVGVEAFQPEGRARLLCRRSCEARGGGWEWLGR